jgi:hypothetical protein
MARENSAFLPLDRKTLTLEGVDLIVDASDLSGRQTALFGCLGSSLTLRDCTVTVINSNGSPFVLVRQDPSARASRIRLERTLVRGGFTAVAELAGGPVDLVLDGSAVLGGIGPVVKVNRLDSGSEQRIFFAGALLASPGPIIQCNPAAGSSAAGRLVIRTYGSAFGRLQGQGIASLVTMADRDATAERRVDWAGDHNLFAGWLGFFARGPDPTITLGNLLQVRSTWNATEQGSLEIPPAWVLSLEPARVTPLVLDPYLPAGVSRSSRQTAPSLANGPAWAVRTTSPGARTARSPSPSRKPTAIQPTSPCAMPKGPCWSAWKAGMSMAWVWTRAAISMPD